MQQLRVNAIVQIPSHLMIIEKTEYEELLESSKEGKWWSLADLEKATNRKRLWLQENILYVPRFKKELEKFVHYPKGGGDNWLFNASKMAKFLDDNFYKIFNT